MQLLRNQPQRFCSVKQLGITMPLMCLGAIGIVTMATLFDPVLESASHLFGEGHAVLHAAHTLACVIGFVAISCLHVVAGVLAPKARAFHGRRS